MRDKILLQFYSTSNCLRVAPTGFYRAAWNGCEAASAWLSAKQSSRAARRSGLKSAMVGKSSVHAASSSCVTSGGMNDPWLRLLYTSLELIRSSRALAAGSAHNVLSMVTYRRIEAFRLVWKFILTGVCGQCDSCKDCRGFKLTDL